MNSWIQSKKENLTLKLFKFNHKHIANYIAVRNIGIYLKIMNYKLLKRNLDKYYLLDPFFLTNRLENVHIL
jgi:hypothetical protein